MVLIYQPPNGNAHVQISWILQRNGGYAGREKDL
jgi:hypothetical protein